MITTITQNDLDLHAAWLRGVEGGAQLVTAVGKITVDADLRGADLSGADLIRANLIRANLSRANLRYANLSEANLSEADLRGAKLSGAKLSGANLRYANLSEANLSRANLSEADLSGADLRGADLIRANLSGANIDFSCWPLWCGSNHVIVDARIAAQLAAHFCALDCDDPAYKAAREALLPFARTSHRAGDLGLLDVENE